MAQAQNRNEAKKAVIMGLYSSWVKASVDLLENTFGYRFDDDGAKVHEVYFTLPNVHGKYLASTNPQMFAEIDGAQRVIGKIMIDIDMKSYAHIDVTDDSGTVKNDWEDLLDMTIAHEFTHAIMMSLVPNFYSLPEYIIEGMAEMTAGADTRWKGMTISLTDENYRESLRTFFETGDSNFGDFYADGSMFLRYMAKQGAAHTGKTAKNVLRDFMQYIKEYGGNNYNDAVAYATGNAFTSMSEVGNSFVDAADLANPTDEKSALAFLQEAADIKIGELFFDEITGDFTRDVGDSGAISGNDANRSAAYKTLQDIVPTATNDWQMPHVKSEVYKGLIIHWDKFFTEDTSSDFTMTATKIVPVTNNSNSNIVNATDDTLLTASAKTSYVYNVADNVTIQGDKSSNGTELLNSEGNYVSIVSGSNGNLIVNEGGKNVTIVGGYGNDSVKADKNAVKYFYNGGYDLLDGFNTKSEINISEGSYFTMMSGADRIIQIVDGGAITLRNYKNQKIKFTGDAEVDTSGIDDLADGLKYNAKNLTLTVNANFEGSNINLTDKKYYKVQTLKATGVVENLNIVGNELENSLSGGKGDDVIDGGVGNDTISGGRGDDTLIGGEGYDTFVYIKNTGNDEIADYTDGEDSIKIFGTVDSHEIYNGNVILNIGDETLTIDDAEGKEITFVKSGGKTSTEIFYDLAEGLKFKTSTRTLTATKKFTDSEINLKNYEAAEIFNGTKLTDGVKVTGNSQYTNILEGGIGDDTLIGGEAQTTFIYTKNSGDDVITNFDDSKDALCIVGKYYADVNGNDVIFSVGNGSLTVKNAAEKSISFADRKGNVYTSQVFSASSEDLLADENFASSADLSDIVKTSSDNSAISVCKIENLSKYDELSHTEKIITGTEK